MRYPIPTLAGPVRLFIFFILLTTSCSKKEANREITPLSADKLITVFNLKEADNALYIDEDITGIVGTDTISLLAPNGTDLSQLKPFITISGVAINPANGVATNFSGPVNYTVTAEDGSTKTYTVIVKQKSIVYIQTDGNLYALNALDGSNIWLVSNSQFFSGTPSVHNGQLFICGNDGLYAFDAKNGAQLWKYAISGPATYLELTPSPVMVDHTVFISCWDGYVYAIDANTGNLNWRTQSVSGAGFQSNVTVNNNMVYTGCNDGKIYALSATSGAIIWSFAIGDIVYENPLIINNNVFTEAQNGSLYLLNGATGAVIWSTGNDLIFSSGCYSNGTIYIGGGTTAHAYNPATGALLWEHFVVDPGGLLYNERSSGIVQDGKFYAGSNNNKFYAFDINTDTEIWSVDTHTLVFSSPVLADGIIYIGCNGSFLYAVNAATGAIKWKKTMMGYVYGSACVIDGDGIAHYPALSGEVN